MFSEDFQVFFNTADFAVSATYTPAGGSPSDAASVIFDANGQVLEEFGVQTLAPSAVLPASQWPTIAEGDTLNIGATAHRIRGVIPLDDGALKSLTLARS
jgi:hypothetical protein